jgi:hypothetical protein
MLPQGSSNNAVVSLTIFRRKEEKMRSGFFKICGEEDFKNCLILS